MAKNTNHNPRKFFVTKLVVFRKREGDKLFPYIKTLKMTKIKFGIFFRFLVKKLKLISIKEKECIVT